MNTFRAEIAEEGDRFVWRGLRTKILLDKVRYPTVKGAEAGAKRFCKENKLDCRISKAKKELK